MLKRLSPATAIACVALFFSMTGAGFAADHYLITSTSQIKPSVLSKLKGKAGPAGPAGTAGVAGADGASFTSADVGTVDGSEVVLCTFGGGSCAVGTSTAVCPTGSVVLGGGWRGDLAEGTRATSSSLAGNSWTVTFTNDSSDVTGYFTAYAQCAS
jgi:hypothetical protein